MGVGISARLKDWLSFRSAATANAQKQPDRTAAAASLAASADLTSPEQHMLNTC